MTAELPLWGRGGELVGVALVDEDTLESLSAFRWHRHSAGYVARTVYPSDYDGRPYALLLHRVLLGLVRGDRRMVDHINGNKLDNRRANLRLTDHSRNAWNAIANRRWAREPGLGQTAGGRWRVEIGLRQRRFQLGTYETEAEAAAVARAFRIARDPNESARVARTTGRPSHQEPTDEQHG